MPAIKQKKDVRQQSSKLPQQSVLVQTLALSLAITAMVQTSALTLASTVQVQTNVS